MPISIITQTRIASLGEPQIIVAEPGFEGLELSRNLSKHPTFEPLPGRLTNLRFPITSGSPFAQSIVIGFENKVLNFFNGLRSYPFRNQSYGLLIGRPKEEI